MRSLSCHVSLVVLLLQIRTGHADDCLHWVDRRLPPGLRVSHAMTYDAARDVTVLFGGNASDLWSRGTWEWDGASWALRTETGPSARYAHAMAYDSARQVTVLFGGSDQTEAEYLGDTWEWDGNMWSLRATTGPSPRASHSLTFDSTRGVSVLFGGDSDLGRLEDTWEWDGANWLLRSNSGPGPKSAHAAAFDPDRDVTVIHGGYDSTNWQSDTWEWDGSVWSLRDTAGPAIAGSPRAMFFDAVSHVTVIFGAEEGDASADMWRWDGASWTQQAAPGTDAWRYHAIAYDTARFKAVMVGGLTSSEETWEWNGTTWTRMTTMQLSPEYPVVATFDSWRNVTVVVDDACCPAALKTWEWDGETWTVRAGDVGLPYPNGLVFDDARGVSVLFHSTPAGGNQTWEWDGAAWILVDTGGPPPRRYASVTFDSWRDVMLVFGGQLINSDINAADLWAFDGENWSLLDAAGPRRAAAGLAFDSMRGAAVLVGGTGEEDYGICLEPLQDTWEWDGASWAHRVSTSWLTMRSHASMTYDSGRGVAQMSSGIECDILIGTNLAEWNGATWGPAGGPWEESVISYDRARSATVAATRFWATETPVTWELVDNCACSAPILRPYAERYINCPGECYAPKNRYVSFVSPAVPGCGATAVALRVTLTDMPAAGQCTGVPDATAAEGAVMWVGPEILSSEGQPLGIFRLQPEPFFRDWKTVRGGVIHVSDCNILPCATYTVDAVTDTQYPSGLYSAPLNLQTTSAWGDVGTPTDNAVNIIDVGTIVDCIKFSLPGSNKTWCDIYGRSSAGGADGKVNVLDAGGAVDALKGIPYPYGIPSAPAVCPPA